MSRTGELAEYDSVYACRKIAHQRSGQSPQDDIGLEYFDRNECLHIVKPKTENRNSRNGEVNHNSLKGRQSVRHSG